jgi:hypothetical protein
MDIPHSDTQLSVLIEAIEQQLEQILKEHDFHEAQEKIHAQLREERESQVLHLQETISLFKTRMQSSVHYADAPAVITDASLSAVDNTATAVLHDEEKETRNSFEPDDLESKSSEIDNILKEVLLSYPDMKISPPDANGDYGNWSSSA